MRRHTPSISCLLAFEASARHLSFTRAAEDLCVSQGAISKLIRALEAELGALLFVREGKRLTLTPSAEAYLRRIQPLLHKLESASIEIKAGGRSSGRLNLAVLPSIAARWLMPRYQDFASRHPDVILNLTTQMSTFDFRTEDIDAAIYFGAEGTWRGTRMERLMQDAMVPICSPAFLARYGPFDDPRRMLDYTFLHLASRADSWRFWFESVGIQPDRTLSGPMFEHYLMIVQVVGAGLGIGLVPYFLVADDLSQGRLCVPYHHVASEDMAYWLVYPPSGDDHRPLRAFRRWVADEMASTERAVDAFRSSGLNPQGDARTAPPVAFSPPSDSRTLPALPNASARRGSSR